VRKVFTYYKEAKTDSGIGVGKTPLRLYMYILLSNLMYEFAKLLLID